MIRQATSSTTKFILVCLLGIVFAISAAHAETLDQFREKMDRENDIQQLQQNQLDQQQAQDDANHQIGDMKAQLDALKKQQSMPILPYRAPPSPSAPVGASLQAFDYASFNFTKFFSGFCLQALPDAERIKAAARLMKGKPLEDDATLVGAPNSKTAKWQGWFFKQDGNAYIGGISEDSVNGKRMVSCSLAVKEINKKNLVGSLQDSFKLTAISSEKDGRQQYQTWQAIANGNPVTINLTTSSLDEVGPATLSAVSTVSLTTNQKEQRHD